VLSSAERRSGPVRAALLVAGIAIALAFAWKLGFFGLTDRAAFLATIQRARSLRNLSLVYIAIYALAAGIGVPAIPLTLAGGALFGARLGIPMNWAGQMLAAMLGFAISRSTGMRAGPRTAESQTSMGRLTQSHAMSTLVRLRLVPIAPFALLNTGAAISGMSWRDFIAATAIGIIPVTVIYTTAASELFAGLAGNGGRALATALIAAVLLIALLLAPGFVRARRRKASQT
jgi:phospholipase D1/2